MEIQEITKIYDGIESMEEKDVNDPIVRRAILEAYKRKCFYCNETIVRNGNYEIDHIISFRKRNLIHQRKI
ncbi:MAG: hypothetical protein ACTSUE_14150 [Promethearchaeota archaeon]